MQDLSLREKCVTLTLELRKRFIKSDHKTTGETVNTKKIVISLSGRLEMKGHLCAQQCNIRRMFYS